MFVLVFGFLRYVCTTDIIQGDALCQNPETIKLKNKTRIVRISKKKKAYP